MDIKKTYYRFKHEKSGKKTGSVLFILRSDLYSSSLDYYLKLFEEAKKDFPDLDCNDVKCVEYGGNTIKGTRGIEFYSGLPLGDSSKKVVIPDGYKNAFILYPTK